ncbi:MAG: hypothetical protein ACJAVK_000740 [Akkermansiaceae bacterium]|jgi:hypothetical protein
MPILPLTLDSASIEQELATSPLGDARLVKRCFGMIEKMSQAPDQSINATFTSEAETIAGYNSFKNPKITKLELLEGHQEKAL